MRKVHITSEVFVAGGTPSVTYNPRQKQRIETTIEQYLGETGKALTIFGPSKSGKTVLVERLLPESRAIWLHGEDINSVEDFWAQLASRLGVGYERTRGSGKEKSVETAFGAGVDLQIANSDWSRTDGETASSTEEVSENVHVPAGVREALKESPKPIVIDDWHFIPDAAKRGLSRAIKTVIRTNRVVLIAVPSEAFELVRTERNMQLRVWSLPIPDWDQDELEQIGTTGFELLNLVDPGGSVARQLADWSYGSPFLMQQLCHDLVRWEFNIHETVARPVTLALPADVDRLLRSVADRTTPPIFDRLLAGPATKGTERAPIRLVDGDVPTDIYGAVLTAIRNLVPPMQHRERAVVAEVQRISTGTVAKNRINNALTQINEIAFQRRDGSDPVLRLRDATLYMQDASLAFYLRHGSWTPQK